MTIILKHLKVFGITFTDELFLANGGIDGFPANNNNSASFEFKTKIAGRTEDDVTKMLKLEYLWSI